MPRYPSPTSQQTEAITAYARLLDEASVRLAVIDDLVAGRTPSPTPITAEFGYLQLRMLCEVVALGCLVAHGDIQATRTSRLQREYAADSILNKLEQLHSNFYPHPALVSPTKLGHHVEHIKTGFPTKAELLRLYHECGERLHRGSLSKFRAPNSFANKADLVKLGEWREKFRVLLASHILSSKNNLSHFICFISHKQAAGKALVVLAQSPLPE